MAQSDFRLGARCCWILVRSSIYTKRIFEARLVRKYEISCSNDEQKDNISLYSSHLIRLNEVCLDRRQDGGPSRVRRRRLHVVDVVTTALVSSYLTRTRLELSTHPHHGPAAHQIAPYAKSVYVLHMIHTWELLTLHPSPFCCI